MLNISSRTCYIILLTAFFVNTKIDNSYAVKISTNLNKTTTHKLKKLRKDLEKYEHIKNPDLFCEELSQILKKEIRTQKGCSERAIVDYWIAELENRLESKVPYDSKFFEEAKTTVRRQLSNFYTSQRTYDNNIDIYFNDVKREYIRHPQTESDDLEFLPENREIFIKNNLKLVINCAKRYQNLGVPFDDLIQAGNVGLCVAFEKFDTDRAKLRKQMIDSISDFDADEFSFDDASKIINDSFVYSKNLSTTVDKLPSDGFSTKDDFVNWTKKNVKTAVFASVAFQWIRAYILSEINKNGKIIRAPKSAKGEDEEEKNPLSIISLDSINPYTNDNYQDNVLSEVTNDDFVIEDEHIENMERQDMFKKIVNRAVGKLSELDARIIRKRFGINLPYQLSITEIAESENMNPNKVKYSISSSLKAIGNSLNAEDKEMINILLMS